MADRAERLVGRTEELALVEQALARAETSPVLIQISGEPGIGKTSLLSELGRRGEERRYLVLAGRASELERDLPYWIFVDALDEYLRSHDPDRLERMDEQTAAELALIFPSLAGAGAAPATVLDERYRVHRAVRELLEQIAQPAPLVLLLDDLHWADPASVDLVAALLRRPPQERCLVAIAVRENQAPPRLAAALDQSARAGGLERIELHALAEDEAGELLGPGVAAPLARTLFEESGGNPFYLEELARIARSSTTAAPAAALTAPGAVPSAVAAALAGEVAGLSAPARSLLEGGSVIGDPFEIDFAAAAGDVPEDEALPALDELLGLGLIRRTDSPRRFRFRHPLLRRAVYDATGSGWRASAHRRAAGALAAHGEQAAVRARHVEQFAPLGDRDAIAVLREAADDSAQLAPESAARWYRAALHLLPADEEHAVERLELLEQLATVLAGGGQYAESHAVVLELLVELPDRAPARTKWIGICAGLEHLLGRHDDAHARLLTALEDLPDRSSAEAIELMLGLVFDALYRRDYESMRTRGLKALELAEELDSDPLRGAVCAILSMACAFDNRIEEGQRYRVEAAAIVDGMTDDQLGERIDAAVNLGNAETYLDHLDDAVRHFDRGIAVSRATGRGQLFPLLTQRKGFALSLLGRIPEAVDVAERAVEAARLSGSAQSVAWALLNRAWSGVMAGDLDVALDAAEESTELGSTFDESVVRIWSACALGSAVGEAGDPARSIDVLVSGTGGPDLQFIPGVLRFLFQERVVQAWLALDRLDEAELAAERAETHAAQVGLKLGIALSKRGRAAVTLAGGDAPAAAALALEAAAAADAIHARIEAARSRTLAGRALAAAGERERAAAELERAAAELDACGAARYRDEAERELRKLGRRFRRQAAPGGDGDGLSGLTARELEVARLVHDRKTNREIAAELFLSEKTVETHLRHIFRKLGVTSRVEVARAVDAADAG